MNICFWVLKSLIPEDSDFQSWSDGEVFYFLSIIAARRSGEPSIAFFVVSFELEIGRDWCSLNA